MSEPNFAAAPDADLAYKNVLLKIASLRERHGITLREMEKRTGYSRSTISNALMGRHRPTWAVFEAILMALGVDPAEYREEWESALEAARNQQLNAGFFASRLPQILREDIHSVSEIRKLAESLKDQKSAVIKLNRLLIIKRDGNFVAKVLSERESKEFDDLERKVDAFLRDEE